jgi:hypothetical protein
VIGEKQFLVTDDTRRVSEGEVTKVTETKPRSYSMGFDRSVIGLTEAEEPALRLSQIEKQP